MKLVFYILFIGYLQMAIQYYVVLDYQYQYLRNNIEIIESNFLPEYCMLNGIWSRYNPLSSISKIGLIGLSDSNCFNIHHIMDQSSSSINLLYYDCIYQENLKIKKRLEFINDEGKNYIFEVDIKLFEYENIWYYTAMNICPIKKQLGIFFFYENQLLVYEKEQIKFPFKNSQLYFVYGGSLVVTSSIINNIQVGMKFSYFPGKIYIEEIGFHTIKPYFDVQDLTNQFMNDQIYDLCQRNSNFKLDDIDLIWLQKKQFRSEYENIDQFSLFGWFKISEIIPESQEFIYLFMRMSSNFENSMYQNQNIYPFQLFYLIQKNKYKIKITTYSYNFPSITYDFTNDPFLIEQEFPLPNNPFIWHNVYVNLRGRQFQVLIKFYDNYEIEEYSLQLQVYQFQRVQFLITYGNCLQQVDKYINIKVRSLIFNNCDSISQFQNCHKNCENCDGPTDTDCLSCSQESKRIYIPQQKSCICPYLTIDDKICKSYQEYDLQVQEEDSSNTVECQYGFFEFDNNCLRCPSIIKLNVMTCLECIQNPSTWYRNSYCLTNLYLNNDQDTVQYIKNTKLIYFIIVDHELQQCSQCTNQNNNIEEIFLLMSSPFIEFCSKSNNNNHDCYECQIDGCLVCLTTIEKLTCIQCLNYYVLNDGQCILNSLGSQIQYCQTPNYITSTYDCKLCPIQNCIYCFEYRFNDLTKCTLYYNFEQFPFDEYLKVGCALCEVNYIYDFMLEVCQYRDPKINNCLRSFINLQGQEVCTLSNSDNFDLSPEINNCEEYFANCVTCILTPESTIKCIICKEGYTTSIQIGNCYKSQSNYALMSIEGFAQYAWIQRIQSFLMQFLPNKYFYQTQYNSYLIKEQPIICIDGYHLNPQMVCIEYCDTDCRKCQFSQDGIHFSCQNCPLNYYKQPIRSIKYGKCLICPPLCLICEERQSKEIQSISPLYQINDQNFKFTMKCIKPINYPNIALNPYLQIAKYCINGSCQSQLIIFFQDYDCRFDELIFFTSQINYLNQIGVQVLTVQYNDFAIYGCSSIVNIQGKLKNHIYSLKTLKLILQSQSPIYLKYEQFIITNFELVEFREIQFEFQSFSYFLISNNYQKLDLYFDTLLFNGFYVNNTLSLFQILAYQILNFQNVSIVNSNFQNSSFIILNQQEYDGRVIINNLTLINFTLINSNFFQFTNNKFTIIIENFKVQACKFQNSSIIQFNSNLQNVTSLSIINLIIENSSFESSLILNCKNYVQIKLMNLYILSNQIANSILILFSYNLLVFQANINKNNFLNSLLIQSQIITQLNVQCKLSYFQVLNNIFELSNLFLINSSLIKNNLEIDLDNFYFESNQQSNKGNSEEYFFNINCQILSIEKFMMKNNQLKSLFYFFDIQEILITNIVLASTKQESKVPLNVDCSNQILSGNSFLQINGFRQLQINNVTIANQSNIDISFIWIRSNNFYSILNINYLHFTGNIILQNRQINVLSLLTITSERISEIYLSDVLFEQNIMHQFTYDPLESSAALMYISAPISAIFLSQTNCKYNALTNSSNSFMFINSKIIKIINLIVQNHNILTQSIWQQRYELQLLDEVYDTQKMSIIMKDTYQILNKGGVSSIYAENIQCTNCEFQNIFSCKSAIFNIKTLGKGIIRFSNISAYNITALRQMDSQSDGAISIFSTNSLLDLFISYSTFTFIFNGMAPSFLTIQPSEQSNKIIFLDLQFIGCISLKDQILNVKFVSLQDKVIIQKVKIIQTEDHWKTYFSQIKPQDKIEISEILNNDNALLNLQGCSLTIIDFSVEGIIISSTIKIINAYKLLLFRCQFIDLNILFSSNLIEIIQKFDFKSIVTLNQITINGIQIYKNNNINNSIQYIQEFKYSIRGCKLLKSISDQENTQFNIFVNELRLFQQQSTTSIIKIQSSYNQNEFQINKMYLQNNNCSYCSHGIIYYSIKNCKKIKISQLNCLTNQIKTYGCINAEIQENTDSQLEIIDSNFLFNFGSQGVAFSVLNFKFTMNNCKIINNNANKNGGGLFLDMNDEDLFIKSTIIIFNIAQQGGGIYMKGNTILKNDNFIKSTLLFNSAKDATNNIFEIPTHLQLFINSLQMPSYSQIINNTQTSLLTLKQYLVIEQGKKFMSSYLILPSNQIIQNYKIYIPQRKVFINYIDQIQIALMNSKNELLKNLNDWYCDIYGSVINQYDKTLIIGKTKVITLNLSIQTNQFDLTQVSFHFDPQKSQIAYQEIEIQCFNSIVKKQLKYIFISKSFLCQLGEFYINEGCQICESDQGFYSVTYNTTKCSIFDQQKFKKITSNQIQLLQGFWRPHQYSDYADLCFKNMKYCQGGWGVGNQLCIIGHIGGFCEECDNFNIQGQGMFFKNLQNQICTSCQELEKSILAFLVTTIWAFLSIFLTLRSIEKSNLLFYSLKIRQKFSKIIFKLEQDHESILIKMFLNYLWIFSTIFTFNINFTLSITVVDQASNSALFMANSLDCVLSQTYYVELIYSRIIEMVILMFLQLIIIAIATKIFSLVKKNKFNNSVISNTCLYLYVSNYAGVIKQFCSIISKRVISNIEYVQGDVSLLFQTETHWIWIYHFVLPGLGIFGCLIPFSLFFILYIKRNQLDKIQFRKHICYLFNEYDSSNYYWELIKLSKKTIIILIMTYFETNILLKASLLGLCLLTYQLLATKSKPYIIQNLNILDLQTGQICSIAIFLGAANYVSEQENQLYTSIILQIFLILLCLRLCYPFLLDIFRVYFKKYKITYITYLFKLCQFIKSDWCLTIFLNKIIRNWNTRESKLKINLSKLRFHLLCLSKHQIKQQKQIISLISSQSTRNQGLIYESERKRLFALDS